MRKLRNISLLLLMVGGLSTLVFKITSEKRRSIVGDLEMPDNISTRSNSVRDKIALDGLVSDISNLSALEANYIGFEGRESKQPNYSMLMEKWARIDQLVALTNHNSPLVRSIAFAALRGKNYAGLKEIFKRHLYDDEAYNFHSGCTVEPVPVNSDFYHCIKPLLSTAEANSYKNILLKKYKGTYYESLFNYP